MKELSIEKMEMVKGGCSFTEMMYYATAQQYHIGGLSSSHELFSYHAAGAGYFTYRMFACM